MLLLSASFSSCWDYGSSRPDTWSEEYPGCGGEKQSLVDILDDLSQTETEDDAISFINYEDERVGNVLNTGHTMTFQTEGGSQAAVTGGGIIWV